jgi:hypothetical protein
LVGLYPALQASRPDLVAFLKAQAGDAYSGLHRGLFRRSLVTAQVAVSLLLLVCAGLFVRTFVSLTRIELGMQTAHLLTFSIEPKLNRYRDAQARALYDELMARLGALPGVVLVSAARVPALAGSVSSGSVTVEGFTPRDGDASESSFNVVGPDYFRTMGIRSSSAGSSPTGTMRAGRRSPSSTRLSSGTSYRAGIPSAAALGGAWDAV